MCPSIPAFPIVTPPKVWRPKPPCTYKPIELGNNDVDADLYLSPRYGRSLRKDPTTNDVPARTDRIQWDKARDSPILDGFLNIPSDLAPNIKTELLCIIHDNWDAFAPAGARRPMLGFQFCIETGATAPVACRQSHYAS